MDLLYAAVVECVEESVVNALTANEEMVGREGHRMPAMPHDRVRELLAARGRAYAVTRSMAAPRPRRRSSMRS